MCNLEVNDGVLQLGFKGEKSQSKKKGRERDCVIERALTKGTAATRDHVVKARGSMLRGREAGMKPSNRKEASKEQDTNV